MFDPGAVQSFLETKLPAALELLRQMVQVNSFTANAEGVNRLGQLTAHAFAPLGFTAKFVPSTNPAWGQHLVLTRTGSSPRNVAMLSHLDTVFPPEEEERNQFHWQVEGDRIFGPGTQDIKGGTVMMWLVLWALRERFPEVLERVTWNLFWNSSEECFSPDFGEVCRRHFDANTAAALVFEAEGRVGEQRALVVARKGRATWRVTVRGRGAHAGSKHAHGANAIVQLNKTLQQVAQLTDYQRDLTVNVGSIRGGTVLNRVPHEAIAEGEFRAFSPHTYAHAKEALSALSGPGSVSSPADAFACQVDVEILTECRPWPRNPQTERLFGLWQDTALRLGQGFEPQQRGGLSDANLIWDAVPTLDGLGPWGDNDHCSERDARGTKLPEFVQVSSFVPKALVNTLALVNLVNGV